MGSIKRLGLGLLVIISVLTAAIVYRGAYSSSLLKNEPQIIGLNTGVEPKSYANFKGLDMDKENINIRFEGRDLRLSLPIYNQLNRYYLPLTEIVDHLHGTMSQTEENKLVTLNDLKVTLDTKKNLYVENGQTHKLKKKAIVSDDIVYISMFDFCKMFGLTTNWDLEHKVLSFYVSKDKIVPGQVSATGRPALIRLEDVTADPYYSRPEWLEKLRIVSDYLYSENVPFYIAWVPRYIDPTSSPRIDTDISKQYNMNNADWVFTLDHMIDRNGIIGLHGYTHQYGNSTSIGGVEFHTGSGDGIPGTEKYVQERINMAIDSANRLEIPYSFFEAPHYAISPSQLKIIEKNFNIVYQPYPGAYSKVVERKNDAKTVKYIPTPLNYVDGKGDVNRIVKTINSLSPNILASFFYHPYIEFDAITLKNDTDGYPSYTYADSSALHQLIKAFKKAGYKFSTVEQL